MTDITEKHESDTFISALGFDWLTSLYDPVMRWTMRENLFKAALISQSDIRENHRVLDLGCGTATLTMLIKRSCPDAVVIGVDGDEKILKIAHGKIAASQLDIELKTGMSHDMDLPDHSFDRVLSSLLFHHLDSDAKLSTLEEVFRILRPGGELHIADFGKPTGFLMRGAFLLVQALDGFASTSDSVAGKLPVYISQAGFVEVRCTQVVNTLFGSISFYRAQKA